MTGQPFKKRALKIVSVILLIVEGHIYIISAQCCLDVLACGGVDKALFGWLVKSSAISSQSSSSVICILLLLSMTMHTNVN